MINTKKIFFLTLITLLFTTKVYAEIKDSIFFTVGDKAVTKSDIVNEMKIILILNNESYSDDRREQLQNMAVKSSIKRTIKIIEIENYDFLEYSKSDLDNELKNLAARIDMDVETLKNVSASNDLDFKLIENQIITELLWNSLIFQLYKDRLSINLEEIDDQLKSLKSKKELDAFLISEIVIKPVDESKLVDTIKDVIDKIKIEGFEKVAMNLSISDTAVSGGDLGWVNENVISEKFKTEILKTPIGSISEPVLLPEGIVIFKIRDKKKVKRSLSLEEEKQQLVRNEKSKILNLHSSSHYDNLRRSISIKFFDE